MKLYVTFLALFGLLTFASSCGDAAGKRLSSSNSKTTQLLLESKTAINNFASALENQSLVSASCNSTTGLPTDTFATGNYNIDAFPCALKTDTKNHLTIQGMMSLYAGLLCAIEDTVDFNYSNSITTHNVTLDSLSSCLSGLSLGGTGIYNLVVKEQTLVAPSNWNYKISIDFPSNSGIFSNKRMYVLIRELGAKKTIKISFGSFNGTNNLDNYLGLMTDIDTLTNTLRFDFYSDYKHHRGVLVGSDSNFNNVVSFYGAHYASNGWGGTQILGYYANSNSYQYNAVPGNVCNGACNSTIAATNSSFSTFSANALQTRLTGTSDADLTFNTALPDQFLP